MLFSLFCWAQKSCTESLMYMIFAQKSLNECQDGFMPFTVSFVPYDPLLEQDLVLLSCNIWVSCLDWKRSSGWLESWEGLLFVTIVLTTHAEGIFRVKFEYHFETQGLVVKKMNKILPLLVKTNNLKAS